MIIAVVVSIIVSFPNIVAFVAFLIIGKPLSLSLHKY